MARVQAKSAIARLSGDGGGRGAAKATAVNQKDIAKALGISQPAVSYTLRGVARVSPELRRRILDAAHEMGYRVNGAARATRTGRSHVASLVLSATAGRSTYSVQLVDGLLNALQARGYHLMLARLPDAQLTDEGTVPRILQEWLCDGLLINYTDHIPPRMVQLIREFALPSVWMNARIGGDCVHPNDFDAGRCLTEHLLALGHRRIAYVDMALSQEELAEAHYSVRDRQGGYEYAMNQAGLRAHVVRTDKHVPRNERSRLVSEWLAAGDLPTAIITYAGDQAETIIHAGVARGLKVPADFSIASFHHGALEPMGFRITTEVLSPGDVGGAAAEMLLKKIDEPDRQLPPQAIGCVLVTGATTAAPRRD